MYKIPVTELTRLLELIEELDLDPESHKKVVDCVHTFSNEHSVLSIQTKEKNKSMVWQIIDKVIPPASQREGGTLVWEEEKVPKPKHTHRSGRKKVKTASPTPTRPRKNIDAMFDSEDIDSEILGFDD